jgi:hypothetical protein
MRTKMIKLILVLALGVIICLPVMARADSTWKFTQLGYYDNYPEDSSSAVKGAIDQIDVMITSGALDFADPGMISYGSGLTGWTVNNIDSKCVVATNIAAPTSADWNYVFVGTGPVYPFTLDWNAYYDGDFKVHEHIALSSSGKISNYYDTTKYIPDPVVRSSVVPLPPSALLFGTGLLGLGFWPRRKKNVG